MLSLLVVLPLSVPPIGCIFGVRNRVDTLPMLERRLGPGEPFTGGHPRGARAWQDPRQGWRIATDGFEHAPGRKGRYIEGIQLSMLEVKSQLPIARRPQYGILRTVRPGMSPKQVKEALRGQVGFWKGNLFFQRGQAEITHATNSEVESFSRWIADFSFEKDRLIGIDLRAE